MLAGTHQPHLIIGCGTRHARHVRPCHHGQHPPLLQRSQAWCVVEQHLKLVAKVKQGASTANRAVVLCVHCQVLRGSVNGDAVKLAHHGVDVGQLFGDVLPWLSTDEGRGECNVPSPVFDEERVRGVERCCDIRGRCM